MADTPEWKTDATAPVLRVLFQAGIGVSPGAITANLDTFTDDPPSHEAVVDALGGLEAQDMVRRLDAPDEYFLLTDHGRDYVQQELEHEGLGYID